MIQILNDAAADAQADAIALELQMTAATLEHHITLFATKPTAAGLEAMTGEWSRGLCLMKRSREYNDKRNGRLGITTPCKTNATALLAPPTIS